MSFAIGKRTWMVRPAVLGCILSMCFSACISLQTPTNADLTVLVTAQDFARFIPTHQIDEKHVKANKVQVAGVSVVTYEYQPGEGLYLSAEASVGPHGSGKEHATRSLRGITVAKWWEGKDLEFEEHPIPAGLDGDTRFFVLRSEGKPIGNAYVTHDDRHGMFLLFSGVYFPNGEEFSTFITPKLRALKTAWLGAPDI